MDFGKVYGAEETAAVLHKFAERYVDRAKLPKRILLWNSLKDGIRTVCRPVSEVLPLAFFNGKPLLLYEERAGNLWQCEWTEIVDFITHLEPWEENLDILIFDAGMEWFAAITHEDLLTVCAGTLLDEV